MPVRIAIVGCGRITQRLALPQLRGFKKAKVASLIDMDASAARSLVKRFRLADCRVETRWKQAVRRPDIDAVAVNVPNALHAEVAVAALSAGKHVLVEKPIATSLREADAIIASARKARRCLMVEQTQRFDPMHETARAVLESGKLGKITRLHGLLGHAGPEYWSGKKASWFADKRVSGGGALIDVGIHLVDLLRWLSGKSVRRVCCSLATLEKRIAVEDNAGLLLEFTDGTLGSCEVSWTTRPYEISTQFYGKRATLRTRFGDKHPVAIDWCKPRPDPNKPAGPEYPAVSSASRVGGPYPYFIDCILKGRKPFCSGEEGRATLAVVLAAYESARTKRWVEIRH